MNRNKRGQSEIISTVLIILLVLAAIIIVWAVVTRIIGQGSKTIDEKMLCTEVALTFDKEQANQVKCVANGAISGIIKRGADSGGDINMKLVIGNKADAAVTAPLSLGSVSFSGKDGGEPGKNVVVKVAAMVGEKKDVVCNPVPDGEVTVTCDKCTINDNCKDSAEDNIGTGKCTVATGICDAV